MSVFVPFPNGAQVELIYVLDGKTISNRLWMWADGPAPTPTDLEDLADGIAAWWVAYLQPFLSQDIQLAAVLASDWSSDPSPYVGVATPVLNGSVLESSHSANVSLVVRFRWPINDARHRRNKNYVPGIPLSYIDLNTPNTFIQDALFEAYVALIDYARTISPGDYWTWVVTSAILGNVPRSEMYFNLAIGPTPRASINIGQRRKRLPIS